MPHSTTDINNLLPNPKNRDKTLALIHEAYRIATMQEKDLPQIASSFYYELVKIKDFIPSEDKDFYFKYMAGVKTCYQERERTFQVTNLITYINILVCYIICWLNTSPKVVLDSLSDDIQIKEFDFDARIISRRKALESELKKILRKALKNDHIMRNREFYSYSPEMSCTIRDRFGFLCILKDSNDEIKNIDILSKCIIDILCEQNFDIRDAFIKWLDTSASDIDKDLFKYILNMTFSVNHFKDYIRNPKPNGYQTLQFTFNIDYDPKHTYNGITFEAQFRTEKMHKTAVEGTASHVNHKNEFGQEFEGLDIDSFMDIIKIDDCSKVNITGFSCYYTEGLQSTDNLIDHHEITQEDDSEGLYLPKVIFSRRISREVANIV